MWQKESFDHIVRSPASLEKLREHIQAHDSEGGAALCVSEDLLRDAAATLLATDCTPFDKPALRQTLETLKQEIEQALDIYTPDEVLEQGFDAAGLVQASRDCLAQNQAQIDALKIIYSLPRRRLAVRRAEAGRPDKVRLTEPMLKELEKKLRDTHATWTEDRLLDAFAVTAPGKVRGRSQAGRFADLVVLVRFRLFYLRFPLPGNSATPLRKSEPAVLARIETLDARLSLSLSHYTRLIRLKSNEAFTFYHAEALHGGWSIKQLDRQISSKFYERALLSKNKVVMLIKGGKAQAENAITAEEEIRDPLVLEFLNLRDEYSESDLEDALIRHLEIFLMELGSDFAFIGCQRGHGGVAAPIFYRPFFCRQ